MSDTTLPEISKPKLPKRDRRKGLRGPVREALSKMVWEMLDIADAAKAAGCTARAIRKAMDKPSGRQFLKQEREAARAVLTAAVPGRLRELAFQNKNMNAAVAACRALEGITDDIPGGSAADRTRPGITFIISPAAAIEPPPVVVDVTPSPDKGPIFRAPLPHMTRR